MQGTRINCGNDTKADEALREIPILFINALDDRESKVRAIAIGGSDYARKGGRAK